MMTIGDFVGAGYLHRAVRRGLPPDGWRLGAHLRPTLAASVVMVVPTALVAWAVSASGAGRLGQLAGIAAGSLLGLAVYAAVQLALRSPDLPGLGSAPRRLDPAAVPAGEAA
jgi:hypothetical protein